MNPIFFLLVGALVGLSVWASWNLISRKLSKLDQSLEKTQRDLKNKIENLSREREEQATLISALSDAILAIDKEGLPLFYNSRFAILFDMNSRLKTERLRLWELIRDPEILQPFKASLQEGHSPSIHNIELNHEEGKKFFTLSLAPLRRSTQKAAYGVVGVFHDVTALKKAEQIRIDFVSNVSHELRSPLTAIKGYADTLMEDLEKGSPISKEFIDVIRRNTSRLMHLINDLLDLSLLESNMDPLQKSEINTSEISAQVIQQLQGSFQTKEQSIIVEALAPLVYADTKKLEQVLVNLLDNASKYTPRGGKITLFWEKSSSTPAILLKVSDTGPGIPKEHHERLFERFYRIDKSRSRELGGTGLGLAIVKHILQRHGGSIWIESTIGHGTTFICEFPI